MDQVNKKLPTSSRNYGFVYVHHSQLTVTPGQYTIPSTFLLPLIFNSLVVNCSRCIVACKFPQFAFWGLIWSRNDKQEYNNMYIIYLTEQIRCYLFCNKACPSREIQISKNFSVVIRELTSISKLISSQQKWLDIQCK